MIKLIDILNEARITPVGGRELIFYETDEVSSIFFQTKRGIEIMKKILDDYNKTHPNYPDTYAWIDDEEDIKEIIDHPLYKLFVNEAYKASSILQPFIDELPQQGIDFYLGNNMEDMNFDYTPNYKLIVGPSILTESTEAWRRYWDQDDIEDEVIPQPNEEIINILSNQGIKFVDVPDGEKIFSALIGQ